MDEAKQARFDQLKADMVRRAAEGPSRAAAAELSQPKYLGDHVEQALKLVGITQDRVAKVLGGCGCGKRKVALNQLDQAAREILSGAVESGRDAINHLLSR